MSAHRDETRGHFVIEHAEGHIIGADLGSRLHLSTYGRTHIDPATARELAAALTWWADREHADGDDDDQMAGIEDLLTLLEREVMA